MGVELFGEKKLKEVIESMNAALFEGRPDLFRRRG
jgi:hypothetical protein